MQILGAEGHLTLYGTGSTDNPYVIMQEYIITPSQYRAMIRVGAHGRLTWLKTKKLDHL